MKIKFRIIDISSILTTFKYGNIVASNYFIPFLSILINTIYIIRSSFNKKFDEDEKYLLILNFSFFNFFSLLSLIGSGSIEQYFIDLFFLFFCFLGMFSFAYLYKNISLEKSVKSLRYMLFFALIFLSIECYIRLTSIGFSLELVLVDFYQAKYDSPFAFDSNIIAIYALIYFLLSIHLIEINKSKINYYICSFIYILIILTFSRAVIITAALAVIAKIILSMRKKYIFLFSALIAPFILYGLYNILISDGSALTKIKIFENIPNTIKELDYKSILIGYGLNEGGYIYSYDEGKFAHSMIPLILGQFGIVGTIAYYIYLFMICKKTTYRLVFFIFFINLCGFSLMITFFDLLFIAIGIMTGQYMKIKKVNFANAKPLHFKKVDTLSPPAPESLPPLY